ncbi:hypothetical protein Asppvi_000025 [Aspergillus pseudoviridinutans]|uniref:Amidohydrolase 3 domain-containing protein n=1 Tax=Aspergillus pseudoviridinutans TaxID=1517512 RepID=A0A9P3B0P9_9EURO|nr:uncharacterized protein Asppvi_000025 [Aspergillus pseudoviridinutans]GIJ81526.1 hypothetical protein Asppvi_000025 [Aspergillus pseudoviridinutans]
MESIRGQVADVIYMDGEVIVNANVPPAQAILIQAGRVAAVGSNEDVLRAGRPDTPCVNLSGAVVIPGLIDTHPHLLHFAAFKASLLDITKARNHAEIVEAIRRRAENIAEGS